MTSDRRLRHHDRRLAALVSGVGVYPVRVAARLLQEKVATIQRWAFGYRRRGNDYPAAITTILPEVEQERALTFLELVETMFIQALLRSGLSWPKVREASRVAARLLKDEPHPFATRRWFLDAAGLYLELGREHNERILVEVAGHGQMTIDTVLRPYLHQLDFDVRGVAQRWFPMGFTRPVVLDPRLSFGMPVTAKSGVPTEALIGLFRGGESISSIAAWYRIEDSEVEAAVEFEEAIAHAA